MSALKKGKDRNSAIFDAVAAFCALWRSEYLHTKQAVAAVWEDAIGMCEDSGVSQIKA